MNLGTRVITGKKALGHTRNMHFPPCQGLRGSCGQQKGGGMLEKGGGEQGSRGWGAKGEPRTHPWNHSNCFHPTS